MQSHKYSKYQDESFNYALHKWENLIKLNKVIVVIATKNLSFILYVIILCHNTVYIKTLSISTIVSIYKKPELKSYWFLNYYSYRITTNLY